MIKLKKGTPDERFKQIEVILNRMSRKLHKTVIGVMPPVPVMFSAELPMEDGNMFTFLSPADGTITSICMYIREFEGNEPIEFNAYVKGSAIGHSVTFRTRKNTTINSVDLPVSAGDLLSISTASPDKIRGILVSFSFQMKMDRRGQEKFITDELLKLTETGNE